MSIDCHNCNHEQHNHDNWKGKCFWRWPGVVRRCHCEKFIFPPIPKEMPDNFALTFALANYLCLADPTSIRRVRVIPAGGRTVLEFIQMIDIGNADYRQWVREHFPHDKYRK